LAASRHTCHRPNAFASSYVIFARLKRFAEIRQALAEFINSPQFLKQLAKE
jgi:hypothetical protein